jgi:calcium permeable stress-gated cation channel
MIAKYTEVAPEDVIWSNLGLNSYEIKVRLLTSFYEGLCQRGSS